MQVSVEGLGGLQKKMVVTIPAQDIDSEVDQRLVKLTKKVRIAGFRPGKVPLKVVKQNYLPSVRSEVVMDMMNKTYFDAIQEKELKPAGMPKIEEPEGMEYGQAVTYTALFEVFPEIKLVEPKKLKIEKWTSEITSADIDNAIDNVRKQQAEWVEAQGNTQKGDRITISYEAMLKKDKVEEESKQDQVIVLGNQIMVEGFEDKLLDKSLGELPSFKIKMPKDYRIESVKGKTLVYTVTITKIERQDLPELDEEFITKMGVKEPTVEALRAEVSSNLERELKYGAKNLLKKRVIDALVQAHKFDIPAALIDQEAERLKQQSMNYFKSMQPNGNLPDMPVDLFKADAEKQVRIGLVLSEFIEKHEIKPDPALVDERIDDIATMYDDAEEAKTWIKSNKQQLEQLNAQVLEDQVVNLIINSANMSEKAVGYDEIIKAAQER